jgi:hypothetical protein
MIRVLVLLWGIVFLVAVDRSVAAAISLPGEAFAPPAIKCEQPANTTAAPGLRSEPDMGSILRQFTTHTETLSQLEAWWRARSKSRDVPQDKSAPSTMKEALTQMDAWWRERTDLHNGIPPEQSSSAMQETIAQMETWWTERAEPSLGAANKPAPTSHHRRYRQRATPVIEYGCPPSVCTIQYGNQ